MATASDRLVAGTAKLIRDCDQADAMPEGPVRAALMDRIVRAAARWPQACAEVGRTTDEVWRDAEVLLSAENVSSARNAA